MGDHIRQDVTGLSWEGWGGDGDSHQSKLEKRVIAENIVQVKPFFGTKQKSYTINYFCWNPIGSVNTTLLNCH